MPVFKGPTLNQTEVKSKVRVRGPAGKEEGRPADVELHVRADVELPEVTVHETGAG